MWLYAVGAGSLIGGIALAVGLKKRADAADTAPQDAKTAAAQGQAAQAQAAAQGAPPPVRLTTQPIQPPGVPQPLGMVSLPAPPPMTPSMQSAVQNLLTYLNTSTPEAGPIPQVKAFQNAFNFSGPSTPLKPDGKYGPKTQAAFQAAIAPAQAPAHHFPTAGSVAAPPSIPAAKPIQGLDVRGAAMVLANIKGPMPKSSDPRVSTFQNAYNQTPGVLHLVVDGKYGGSAQGALESVLNWMGTGLVAPPNSFGLAIVRPAHPYPGTSGAPTGGPTNQQIAAAKLAAAIEAGKPVQPNAAGLAELQKNTAMPSRWSQAGTAFEQAAPALWNDVWGY
jgi:hypothetical protein